MSQPDSGLLAAAAVLVSRIRHHASVLSSPNPDPADVVAASDAVGSATTQYASQVFDLTGWGSPFAPPPDDEDDTSPPEGIEGDGVTQRIRINAEYVVEVASEEGLRRLTVSRGLPVERQPDGGEGTVLDLVAALFEADGWKPEDYGDEVVRGYLANWAVDPMHGVDSGGP